MGPAPFAGDTFALRLTQLCICIGASTPHMGVLPVPDTSAGLRAVNVLCSGQVLALSEL